MATPVYRPKGVLAGTFGVGILTFLLLPSEVGYQDLAALLARDGTSVDRLQKHSMASPFGTIHATNLNLPQPVGSGIKPSLGYTLAGLDPNNADITGSIRDRVLRENALSSVPGADYPRVDRSRKGDQLTVRQNERVALKGDRLDAQPQLAQTPVPPAETAAAGAAPQIAEAPPGAPLALTPPLAVVQSDRQPAEPAERAPQLQQPAPETQPNGFTLASAGDYRIGLNTKQFEALPVPPVAAPPAADQSADGAAAKAAELTANLAFAAGEENPSQRAARLYFSVDPMGQKLGAIEPWAPGEEPRLDDAATAVAGANGTAAKGAEIKLAALPPAASTFDLPPVIKDTPVETSDLPPAASPDQSVTKDPTARGGESVAPKGEVTGADKRPMTPAERLGLNDEKSRAKSEKCLTEVIYFEARGEVVRGQMAVAQVVLNRAFSGKYPSTVCGVVYQNAHRHLACQFTFACDGIPDVVKEPDMWERAKVIAAQMLDGKIWLPEIGKATHYHAYWVHPGWVREMTKLHRVGVHTFYRPRAWGDGTDAPQWSELAETQEWQKKLVEVAKKP